MPKYITIGLFETSKTLGKTLARSLQDLLKQYGLIKKIFDYVKNEGANLNTMTIALKSIKSWEALGVIESFQGTCFEHAFYKAC
jgi:hypothetical protein